MAVISKMCPCGEQNGALKGNKDKLQCDNGRRRDFDEPALFLDGSEVLDLEVPAEMRSAWETNRRSRVWRVLPMIVIWRKKGESAATTPPMPPVMSKRIRGGAGEEEEEGEGGSLSVPLTLANLS